MPPANLKSATKEPGIQPLWLPGSNKHQPSAITSEGIQQ